MTTAPKPRLVDRIFGPSPAEKFYHDEVDTIEAALNLIHTKLENFDIDTAEGPVPLSEALRNIDLMIDQQGWTQIWDYDGDTGLTLRQVKDASQQIRELLVGNPYVGNGFRVRAGATWAAGVEFSSRLRRGNQEPKPLPADIQRMMEEPAAIRYLWGNSAHIELERQAFSDGNVLFLGRDSDHRGQRLQMQEITGILRNPNNSEEIWAYRRSWNPNPQRTDLPLASPSPIDSQSLRTRWYYTDIFPTDERRSRIRFNGVDELAEPGYTIIDQAFNRQVGWSLGVPDALCIVAWSRLYKKFLVNGYVMSRSLARLAFRLTVNSTKGRDQATTIERPGQAGSTFVEGTGNTLTTLATAGKGYDFASGNGLATSMASGLGISVSALLSTSGAASGSNAAEQTFDPIVRRTAIMRRREWDDWHARMFRWMGMDRKLITTWRDLPEEQVARMMQGWTLADQAEVFGQEVMQREISRVLNVSDPGSLPEGWKPYSQRGANDAGTLGKSGATGGTGQGQGGGSGSSGNDPRSDRGDD